MKQKTILFSIIALFIIFSFNSCSDSNATKPSTKPLSNIQILTTTKKQNIDKMIAALQSGSVTYEWMEQSSCNIGVLAQCVTNKTQPEISKQFINDYQDFIIWNNECIKKFDKKSVLTQPDYCNLINYYCGVTGKPMIGFISNLNKAGFSNTDIKELEYLSNKEILKLANINTKKKMYFGYKDNLIKYLKAWETILK